MNPDYAEAVASWLAKAKSDLGTANVLIRGAELHLDTGSCSAFPLSTFNTAFNLRVFIFQVSAFKFPLSAPCSLAYQVGQCLDFP